MAEIGSASLRNPPSSGLQSSRKDSVVTIPTWFKCAGVAAAALVGACVSVPDGPSVLVLPGTGKNFDQFRADDMACRQFASFQVGNKSANQAGVESGVTTAAVGAALGAAAGALIGGTGSAAAMGAGAGLAGGALVGS